MSKLQEGFMVKLFEGAVEKLWEVRNYGEAIGRSNCEVRKELC